MLRFGKITGIKADKAKYQVTFDEDALVSGWIPANVKNSKDNKEESGYDFNEHVSCLMDEHCEYGVILGAIYDEANLPEVGNADVWQKKFKDGSFIKFDRAAKKLTLSCEGDVEVVKSTKLIITASDVIELNGNANSGITKAAALKTKLNNLENLVNSLVTKFNSHVHVLTLTAGTGTAAPTVLPESTVLTPTVEADIRNDKVKH